MRILLIQPKRIGDLILTAPAVNALRSAFPGCHITLLAAGSSGGIAPLLGADETLTYHFRRPNLPLWSSVGISGYNLALDFGGTGRSALMARISRAQIRITYKKFVAGRRRARAYTHLAEASVRDLHTADFHLALVAEALRLRSPSSTPADPANGQNAPPSAPAPVPFSLHIPGALTDAARAAIESHTGDPDTPYAIVHPGTARPEKYWYPDRWAEVIHHLAANGLTPVITGSDDPAERGHLARIHEFLGKKMSPLEGPTSPRNTAIFSPLDLAGKITLPELAALIAGSRIAVGVDSAAMHLAAAARRPQVVLFGPTNPFHWRPRHEAAAVFVASHPDGPTAEFTPRHQKAPMSHISTTPVLRAIDTLLK